MTPVIILVSFKTLTRVESDNDNLAEQRNNTPK
jgi:hypothetical protein